MPRHHDAPESSRRQERIAELITHTGIDEALIERLVRRFYEHIQQDSVLGPIFAARIADWEPHLQRMFSFWSSVCLASGRYHGQPMQKHASLPVDARHFDRWLALFASTAREVCSDEVAEQFIERARRIATSLEMGRADAHGMLLSKGERFLDPSLSIPDSCPVDAG
ncbi:MAG: group III truncated hemoglobin [Steroidobacteraceae bacterium]